MSIPLPKIITPLHHLHPSPSLPPPPTTLFFTTLPLSRKPKRSTLTITRSSATPPPTTEEHSATTLASLIDQVKKEHTGNNYYDEDDEEEERKEKVRVAERWKEIHGETDWAGLLDPMDPLLKLEIIKYGDMAQACYDAFDYDSTSRYCGSSKYCNTTFFSDLGLPDAGYDVTRYLYAISSKAIPNFFRRSAGRRSWSNGANWIGYVAVSDDETTRRIGRRDIVVAWRGTVTKLEWVADLMDFLVGFPGHPEPGLKVESGFLGLYTEKEKDGDCRFCHYSAREQVLAEVRHLVRHYSSRKVSIICKSTQL